MARMGKAFKESDSDSTAMIVLEGDQPLGPNAHQYYADLIRQLRADTKHVQHIQDFWGIRSRRRVRKAPTVRLRMFS